MIRLILWRHGNTDWNNDGRIQGQTDTPLNDRGRAQAAEAAKVLAGMSPDLIISSDLSRTWDTAAALSRITGLPVEKEPRLRERSFGLWEEQTIEQIKERFPDSYARWSDGDPAPGEGLEPLPELGKRVAEVIREVAERNPDGLSVLVTHGGSVRWGVGSVLGWPGNTPLTLGAIGNCHWSVLGYEPGRRGWQLLTHNTGV